MQRTRNSRSSFAWRGSTLTATGAVVEGDLAGVGRGGVGGVVVEVRLAQ